MASGPSGISRLKRHALDALADGGPRQLNLTLYISSYDMEYATLYGGLQPTGWIRKQGDVWFPSNLGAIHIRQPNRIKLSSTNRGRPGGRGWAGLALQEQDRSEARQQQAGNLIHRDAVVAYSNWHTWGYNDEDASLLKRIGFGADARYGLTLRAEFFNVFNRHYWANANLTMGSSYFGHVTDTTGNPRQGQLGARFER